MSALSYGLNVTKKPSLDQRPPPAKRKTIFDDVSSEEDGPDDESHALENISTIGGIQTGKSKPSNSSSKKGAPPSRLARPSKISQYGDLSSNHSTSKHSKNAQEIDASIYDYDGIYDSLHAPPSGSSEDIKADVEKRPKYMSNLMAAAEVRKRDQLRAKEKMLAKEREAEGDEFADKEKFVTGAYKRQQEEMKRLEEEEAAKERAAEERKRREGGGMKALYKNLLERDEEKHQSVMKAVVEGKGKNNTVESTTQGSKEKSETELAKQRGAMVNEDGQVVDKRQLLSAGLNAGAAPKARPAPPATSKKAPGESARARETRMFEDQLLGKHAASSDEDDDDDQRAAKSRKLEDELLGLGTASSAK